jgi:hypothetical protein
MADPERHYAHPVSRPSHQQFWWITAGAVGAVGSVFLAAGLAASPFTWLGVFMIIAYACAALAVAAFIPSIREWRFPLAKISPKPQFPVLDPAPDDDLRSEVRQALDLGPSSELSEGVDAAFSRRRQRYDYCATCFPLDPPNTVPDCNGGADCDNRLKMPASRRRRIVGPMNPWAVHPQWLHEHPETG